MKTKRAKHYLILSILVIIASAALHKPMTRYLERKAIDDAAMMVAQGISDLKDQSFHVQIDSVREYIHAHSVHASNKEFHALWKDPVQHYQTLIDYANGARATPSPMECSVRSSLMERILRGLGYETRTIVVYNATTQPRGYDLESHTFIDVWNPHAQRWETQDPDYNIYFANVSNPQNRGTFLDAMQNPDMYQPCLENKCGWEMVNKDNMHIEKLRTYMDIVSVVDRSRDKRYSFHQSHISENRAYTARDGNGKFCDILRKNCRNGWYEVSRYTGENLISVK